VAGSERLGSFTNFAQPCLSVRTKASDLPPSEIEDEAEKPSGKARLLRFALEAQLENLADEAITLEAVSLNPKPPFKSTSINWDVARDDLEKIELPILGPRDVMQVAFLLEQQKHDREGGEGVRRDLAKTAALSWAS
jgi:hypothetical protein